MMRNEANTLPARVLLASVFVVMGTWRLYAAWQGAAISNGTVVFSALELVLGLLVMAGWKLRWTAIVSALLLLVDALLSHPFWSLAGAERGAQLLHFMKNIAIVGGFVLLAAMPEKHRHRFH